MKEKDFHQLIGKLTRAVVVLRVLSLSRIHVSYDYLSRQDIDDIMYYINPVFPSSGKTE